MENCLKSILGGLSEKISYEIIVVDNASSDGTVSKLRKTFPQVRFFVNSKNVGFARANNQGVKKSSGEVLFFLNPDTLIRDGCIMKLVDFIQNKPSVGVIGPRVLWPNGLIQVSYVTYVNEKFNFIQYTDQYLRNFLEEIFKTKKFRISRPIKVASVRGMAMMVKKEVFEEVSGFDEDFFLNAEAGDLCFRVRERGFDNYFFPAAEVIHFSGRSKAQYYPFCNLNENVKSVTRVLLKDLKRSLSQSQW